MAASKSSKQPPLMTPPQLITAFIFSNILFLILGMAIGKGDFSVSAQNQPASQVSPEAQTDHAEPPSKSMEEFYSLEETPRNQKKQHIDLAQTRKPEVKKPNEKREAAKKVTPPPKQSPIQTRKPVTQAKQSNRVAKKAPKPVRTSKKTSGAFYLQLAASKDRAQAKKFLKKVQAKGYPASLHRESGFYKVRLGHYDTREKAQRMKVDVDAELKIDSWIKAG